MTVFAGFGRRLVEENKATVHRLPQRMACRTGDVFVASFQRKAGLVVVEE